MFRELRKRGFKKVYVDWLAEQRRSFTLPQTVF